MRTKANQNYTNSRHCTATMEVIPRIPDTSMRIFKDDPDSDLAPRADTQENTGHSQTHIIQGITRQENEIPKNTPQVLVKNRILLGGGIGKAS